MNEDFYRSVLKEDSIVEWLTFVFLVLAGCVSFMVALKIWKTFNYLQWFFILFSAFNILAGLEEISWGQRIFGIETTGVFHKYSDQNEVNLHNTFQGVFHIKTKHIALIVLFIYGCILPGIIQKGKFHFDKMPLKLLIIPPMFLRLGFAIASILMLDFQTGHEEEIGEFFFSICFFIMMLWNLELSKNDFFREENYLPNPNSKPSLSE